MFLSLNSEIFFSIQMSLVQCQSQFDVTRQLYSRSFQQNKQMEPKEKIKLFLWLFMIYFFVLLFFLILSTSFINKFQFLLLIMMLMILLSCETLGNIRTISRSTLGHFQKINFLNFSFILFTFKLQILGLSYCDISKTKL